MATIRETSKRFGAIAKQENRLSEKFSKTYPHYLEWCDSLFVSVKGELITLLGRC